MRRTASCLAIGLGLVSLVFGAFAGDVRSATDHTTAIETRSAFHSPNLTGKSIKVIYTGDLAASEMVLAHAEGLLRQWGAKVDTVQAGSTTIALGAVATGQVDVAEVSPLSGLLAAQNGLNVKAFSVSIPKTDDVFVSRPEVKTLNQLKGARIGILSFAALSGAEAGIALGSAKPALQYSDASVVSAGATSVRVAALLANRLDATAMSLDTYTMTLKSQGYNLLFNYATQMPNFIHSLLWATPSWLTGHSAEALAFNEALLQSFRWFDNPKNKNAFVQLTTSLVPDTNAADNAAIYDTYQKLNFFPPNVILSNLNATVLQTVFLQYGLIPAAYPLSQWIDTTFAKQALSALGTAATPGHPTATALRVAFSPARPKAGATFRVTGTGIASCSATLSGHKLPAGCSWKLSAKAHGQRLTVRVTGASGAVRTASFTVR